MPSIINQQISKQYLVPWFGMGRRPKIVLLVMALIWTSGVNAQTCRDNSRGRGIPSTTPDSVLIDNDNGTVTDTRTKLMWMQCIEGQTLAGATADARSCTGDASKFTWEYALKRADAKEFAGHSDWRLPNMKELYSIIEISCYGPSLNKKRFPGTSATDFSWSSTSSDRFVNYASNYSYVIYFNSGYIDTFTRDKLGSVRLVRAGP